MNQVSRMNAPTDWPGPQGRTVSSSKLFDDVGVDGEKLFQGVPFCTIWLFVKIRPKGMYTDDVLQGLVVGGFTFIFTSGGM